MIEISGSIIAELDGQQMVISGEGAELKLEVDHPDQIIKSLNARRFQGKQALRKLAMELQQRGLTFRLLSRRKTVAVLGYSARAGLISKLLRVQHLELARSWRVFKLLIS